MNTRYIRASSAYPVGGPLRDAGWQTVQNSNRNEFVAVGNNFSFVNGRFPSFTVGPCPIERKPREVMSAKFRCTFDNVTVSMRHLGLGKRTLSIDCKSDAILTKNEPCELVKRNVPEKDEVLSGNISSRKILLQRKQLSVTRKKRKLPKPTNNGRSKRSSKKLDLKRQSLRSAKGKRLILDGKGASKDPTISRRHRGSSFSTLSLQSPKQSRSLPTISPSAMSRYTDKLNSSSASASFISSTSGSTKSSSKTNQTFRTAKIYLSDKQSGTLMGIPAVPPGTPCSEFHSEIEWIPSMSDIKSKRLISSKLAGIELKQNKRENEERLAREQKKLQEEKQRNRELLLRIKQQQRAEIYALNKILTEEENNKYEKLKAEKGLPV